MNTITLYDGSVKQVANGIKLLAQVPRHEKGACRVCGEVVQKSRPNQAQCGKDECRVAFDTHSRKQQRHAASPPTAPVKPAANEGNPDSPLRAGELQRFRSIVRKNGCSLGDHVRGQGYQVEVANGAVVLCPYTRARDFESLPGWLKVPGVNIPKQTGPNGPPPTTPGPKGGGVVVPEHPVEPRSPVMPKLAMARVLVAADAVRASKTILESALLAMDAARVALASFEQTLEVASVEAVHEGISAEEVEAAIAEVWSA